MRRYLSLVFALALLPCADSRAAPVTVLMPDRTIELKESFTADSDLWVTPDDLTRINGFVLKDEGACSGDLCIPIKRDPSAGFVRDDKGQPFFNLSKLARTLDQPVAAELEHGVWSFGEIAAVRINSLASTEAPDFTLPDRKGNLVRLSQFRGKKVLLLTWASWCGCSLDLPNWEKLYVELKDKNFEIVAAAEDTAGAAAADKFYDRAKATYTTLIDRDHVVSSLYHMVNVPAGVWIDEQGKVVRPAEVAYTRDVALLSISVKGSDYVAGLRDWVEKGPKSKYVMKSDELKAQLAPRSPNESLADAHFKLGSYFKEHDLPELAEKHWHQAQSLNPDSWNYHRQDWSYSKDALKNWMKKVRQLGDKPYYAPLKLPTDS